MGAYNMAMMTPVMMGNMGTGMGGGMVRCCGLMLSTLKMGLPSIYLFGEKTDCNSTFLLCLRDASRRMAETW